MTGLADGRNQFGRSALPASPGLGVHPGLFLQMPKAPANCNFCQSASVRFVAAGVRLISSRIRRSCSPLTVVAS